MKNILVPFVLAIAFQACNPAPKPASQQEPKQIPTPPPPGEEVYAYICSGTEPFWMVEISADGIVFQTPEIPPVKYPYAPPAGDDAGSVYISTATIKGQKSTIKVSLFPGVCSDGMSDNEYPYFSEVVRDGETYKGCARDKE